MPAAAECADASNHESDSEEDLDYVPEGEERGLIHTVAQSLRDLQALTSRL
jgi:hypothetical protein